MTSVCFAVNTASKTQITADRKSQIFQNIINYIINAEGCLHAWNLSEILCPMLLFAGLLEEAVVETEALDGLLR
jgi:hypothetical protein